MLVAYNDEIARFTRMLRDQNQVGPRFAISRNQDPATLGEIEATSPSQELIGYSPKRGYITGLTLTIQWYKSTRNRGG